MERSDVDAKACATNQLEPTVDVLDLDHDGRLHAIVTFVLSESDPVYE